jgi:hypothetical protein
MVAQPEARSNFCDRSVLTLMLWEVFKKDVRESFQLPRTTSSRTYNDLLHQPHIAPQFQEAIFRWSGQADNRLRSHSDRGWEVIETFAQANCYDPKVAAQFFYDS